ncbi:MAG: dihydrofolate reductase [Oscillospiraceae bacterium]|nr:dihydrofolate reductase [Oscillospiraceae bacterium]
MNAIVAVNSDWGIGYNNTQSIVIDEDRKFFKTTTDGGTVIVGRTTFEDFGSPLPNRRNIVMTRDEDFTAEGIFVAHTIDEVLALVANDDPDKVFVIGGGSIYNMFLHLCSYAYITKIDAAPLSNVFFPNLDELPDWTVDIKGETLESVGVKYSFDRYVNTSIR